MTRKTLDFKRRASRGFLRSGALFVGIVRRDRFGGTVSAYMCGSVGMRA